MRQISEFFNWILLTVLYFKQLLQRIKILIGLTTSEYGMSSPLEYEGVLVPSRTHDIRRIKAASLYDRFRHDDVVIANYPKSGNHFTADVILSLYKETGLVPQNRHATQVIGAFEFIFPELSLKVPKGDSNDLFHRFEQFSSPRLVVTHLPWSLLPPKIQRGEVKVINTYRNPKDVMCSMLAFFKKMYIVFDTVQMKDYIYWFMEGKVIHGSYMRHLRELYPNRNQPYLLSLQYEDMTKNLKENVRRIAEFLNIKITPRQLDAVVAASTFENKKQERGKNHPVYRKGKVGSWKSELTVEQNEMMDEWIQREMEGLEDLPMCYE
ncbi:amine sulfotransferase-like [Watersipora subatra]|uniref:amine sulfotransferase-like n=1 Tax=Watersipora subatra TaxID=2589382 RepID=UPI00355BD3B4